jgi:hypothetical protein
MYTFFGVMSSHILLPFFLLLRCAGPTWPSFPYGVAARPGRAGASKQRGEVENCFSFFFRKKKKDYLIVNHFFMRILCHRPRMSRGAATGTVGRCCTRTPLMMSKK